MADAWELCADQCAGDLGDWFSFDVPDAVDDSSLWWVTRTGDDETIDSFVERANLISWGKIAEDMERRGKKNIIVHHHHLWVKVYVTSAKKHVTNSFKEVAEYICSLADYPCLDDTVVSGLESSEAIERIRESDWGEVNHDAFTCFKDVNDAAVKIYEWIWKNNPDAFLENVYVGEIDIRKAVIKLGWAIPQNDDEFVLMISNDGD